jgi:hypothetical protein
MGDHGCWGDKEEFIERRLTADAYLWERQSPIPL